MRNILLGPMHTRGYPLMPRQGQAVGYLRSCLDKVLDYRRDCSRAVDGSHLLMRLLGSITANIDADDDAYLWTQEDSIIGIASTLDLTSIWSPGRLHRNVCYNGIDEVVTVNFDPFDVEAARAQWEEMMPIRIKTHPYASYTLPWLDGKEKGLTPGGMAVIEINSSMLALQYKCFCEKMVNGNPDSPPGMNLFLQRYPLANALLSHLDIVLANRTMARALGVSTRPMVDQNPMYLNFGESVADQMLDQAIDFMERKSMSFDEWLSAIPQLSASDYHQWIDLPDLAFSTRMEWAAFLTQLPAFQFLLPFNELMGVSRNQGYLNQLKHWLMRLRNGRLLQVGLRGPSLVQVNEIVSSQLMPFLAVGGKS